MRTLLLATATMFAISCGAALAASNGGGGAGQGGGSGGGGNSGSLLAQRGGNYGLTGTAPPSHAPAFGTGQTASSM
jgi:hypothetical protein